MRDPFIVSNLVDSENEEIVVGMRVEACFVEIDEALTLPQFRPAARRGVNPEHSPSLEGSRRIAVRSSSAPSHPIRRKVPRSSAARGVGWGCRSQKAHPPAGNHCARRSTDPCRDARGRRSVPRCSREGSDLASMRSATGTASTPRSWSVSRNLVCRPSTGVGRDAFLDCFDVRQPSLHVAPPFLGPIPSTSANLLHMLSSVQAIETQRSSPRVGNTPCGANRSDRFPILWPVLPVHVVLEHPRRQGVDGALHLAEVEVHTLAGSPSVEQARGKRSRSEAGGKGVGDRPERPYRLAVGPTL